MKNLIISQQIFHVTNREREWRFFLQKTIFIRPKRKKTRSQKESTEIHVTWEKKGK